MLNSFDTSKISAKPLTKVLTSSPSVPSPEGPGQGKIKPLMTNSPGIEMEGLEPLKSYPSEFLRDIRFASSDTARPTPEVRKMAANNSSFLSYDLEPYISEGRSTTQDLPSSLAGDFNSEPGDFYTDYDSDSDCSLDDYQYEDCMDEKILFYGTPVSCIGEFVPGDLTQAVTSGPPISTPDKSFDTPKDTRPNFKEQIRYLKSSVIPWGKFKGYYDTRSLVCAHKVYHAKRLTKW
ncbi:hypothetical protein BABINDRAFT_145599 [Babjeviella inositovora NRRL Y-12698]|uniref:Uncharacterized protein n=1 Tax=Babjeviella inositovora NRRL Y-12698 TaxID=984486 RepID=A0A1E3QPQ7_9ASCO|nr:uncharacterized protein BABINDRAFT_145599 [Babjeviella inositovora NRRL Y-12698]ODQ79618.1 hypothetical protein BABINDRAFT_145599 [Babjeviella inositovora NRRL Y-12698]